MKKLPALFASLILLFLAVLPTAQGSYNVQIRDDRVHVEIAVNINQNITALQPRFEWPAKTRVLFEGENASSAFALVQKAVQSKTPIASVEGLRVLLETGPSINMTISDPGLSGRIRKGQWFNVSLSFDAIGIVKQGVPLQTDLSWRSFRISDEISHSGVSVNQIGSVYLITPFQDLVDFELQGQQQQFRTRRLDFLVDGLRFRAREIPDIVLSLVVLDFSDLAVPLQDWESSFEFSEQRTKYTRKSGFDLSVVATVSEPEGDVSLTYSVRSSYDVVILAPGTGTAHGDLVFSEGRSGTEILMSAIIAAPLATLVATSLLERKWNRTALRRKPRKR